MIRLVEVIVTSAEDARAAEDGGAGRLEIVSDLARGGMTAPLPVVEAILSRVRVPARAMLRRTESHVVGDPAVAAALIAEAGALASLPLEGIVAGFVREGSIDEPLLARVLDASPAALTFHRAFEDLRDPDAAVAALRRTNRVDRILFNGGGGDLDSRVAALSSLARRSAPGVIVIAGGGVTLDLVARLADAPVELEVHVGRPAREPATVDGRVSAQRVREIVKVAGL